MGRYWTVAVQTILSILKSNVQINLNVVAYFPCVTFTEGTFLSAPQYDSQRRTSLSRVLRKASPLSPKVLLSLCSCLLKPNSLTAQGGFIVQMIRTVTYGNELTGDYLIVAIKKSQHVPFVGRHDCRLTTASTNHHHHHHHVPEGVGVFPVPWSSRWSWSLHLFLSRPMFLRPFGLYFSACFLQ